MKRIFFSLYYSSFNDHFRNRSRYIVFDSSTLVTRPNNHRCLFSLSLVWSTIMAEKWLDKNQIKFFNNLNVDETLEVGVYKL